MIRQIMTGVTLNHDIGGERHREETMPIRHQHGITLCTRPALYLWEGKSFCSEHIAEAIEGQGWVQWKPETDIEKESK